MEEGLTLVNKYGRTWPIFLKGYFYWVAIKNILLKQLWDKINSQFQDKTNFPRKSWTCFSQDTRGPVHLPGSGAALVGKLRALVQLRDTLIVVRFLPLEVP